MTNSTLYVGAETASQDYTYLLQEEIGKIIERRHVKKQTTDHINGASFVYPFIKVN